MNGNRLHNGYVSIRKGDYTLTSCLEGNAELREKVNQLWDIISAVDEFFSLGKPTAEENEAGAIMCEQWCKVFPVLFPQKSLTRKMVEMSLVMPKFIRDEKPGFLNKILRLEQEGERQHAEMNTLEEKYKQTMQKGVRYWQMLCDKENKLYA